MEKIAGIPELTQAVFGGETTDCGKCGDIRDDRHIIFGQNICIYNLCPELIIYMLLSLIGYEV